MFADAVETYGRDREPILADGRGGLRKPVLVAQHRLMARRK